MLKDPVLKKLAGMARRKKGFTRADVLAVAGPATTRPRQPRLIPSRLIHQLADATGSRAVIEKLDGQPKRYRLEV